MNRVVIISFMLAFLAFWSCEKEPEPVDVSTGTGTIDLRLNSGNAITLQTKTNLTEGLEFNNVLVILVNNSGNVVRNVYKTYPYTNQGGGDLQDSEGATSVTEDVIHLSGLLPGTYHVYAYANIDATEWQQTGANLISVKEQLATSGSFSTYLDRELLGLTTNGRDVPADPSTSMLLTGHKEISVSLSPVSPILDLLRPVVRFKVSVQNHTRFPLTINELRFSAFSPDKAYLLDHRNASGVPSVPAGAKYRAMPAFDPTGSDDNSVAANSNEVVYQRLVYENASADPYKIFTTLTLDRSGESLSNLQISLGDNPFGVIDYTTLNNMAEGEQVDVLFTNPQISTRSGRIFAYISANNYMAWESAGYDNYNAYFSRAKAIYDQDASFTYTGYTNADTDGYSAWDGVSANPKEDNSFSYTGKRSQYFHTISKSGGLYTIDGLAINNANTGTVTGTSISNLRIENGVVVSGKNTPGVGGKLVRFINNSNGQYIKANANWEKIVPKKKESNLRFEAGGANQDRQFMLFGKYMSGGLLKRILKDNNKEVALTYMARNEEINVVLNVYYADQTGEITFSVDNSHWTDANATEAGHTFN